MTVLGWLAARRHPSRLGMSVGPLTVGDVAAMMGKGGKKEGTTTADELCAGLFDDESALDAALADELQRMAAGPHR